MENYAFHVHYANAYPVCRPGVYDVKKSDSNDTDNLCNHTEITEIIFECNWFNFSMTWCQDVP